MRAQAGLLLMALPLVAASWSHGQGRRTRGVVGFPLPKTGVTNTQPRVPISISHSSVRVCNIDFTGIDANPSRYVMAYNSADTRTELRCCMAAWLHGFVLACALFVALAPRLLRLRLHLHLLLHQIHPCLTAMHEHPCPMGCVCACACMHTRYCEATLSSKISQKTERARPTASASP